MNTRFFLTVIAAVMMAANASAQKFLDENDAMLYTEVDGHAAAIFDMDDDGEVDYMIVDADDSNDLSSKDLMIELEDNYCITYGELIGEDEESHFIESDKILSYDEFEGHETANIDLDGDGEMDMTLIDADDSHDFSDADIMIDYNEGSVNTVGEYVEE